MSKGYKIDQSKLMDVICMGRVAVDLYAEQIHSPLRNVSSFKKYLGGSPGNISVGTKRLGVNSAIFSCVGKDEMGVFVKETLHREGVNTRLLYETDRYLTGLVLLGIDPPDHFPLLFYRNECADMQLNPSQAQHELFSQTKIFQFSGTGISTQNMRRATLEAIKQARNNDAMIVLDLDYRPVLWGLTSPANGELRYVESKDVSAHYQSFLPLCDLVVGTDEEIQIAGGCDNVMEAIQAIKALSQADIVHKKGLKGSDVYFHFDDEVLMKKAYPVDVFNTLGAGDGFMSGLLYGLLQEASWSDILSFANACGAIVSARHGCAPAMPTENELLYFIEHYAEKGKAIVFDSVLAMDTQRVKRSPLIKHDNAFFDGKTDIVRKDDSYQTGMNFSILKLRQGESYTLTSPLESAFLLMTGKVNFHYDQMSQQAYRGSYFKGSPIVLHLSAYTKSHVDAMTDCEIIVMQTENERSFEPLLFDEKNMLENDNRGKGILDDTSHRLVRTVFDKRNRPESNLVVGEIITFSGRWSSCPPHSHVQPEIYHYRFSEPGGFAFSEDGEDALKVKHNDTLVIRDQKQHAHSTAPGYALYTLWFIRHLKDNPYITPEFAKAHDWVRFESANKRVIKIETCN